MNQTNQLLYKVKQNITNFDLKQKIKNNWIESHRVKDCVLIGFNEGKN